jgi:hypothetical protein
MTNSEIFYLYKLLLKNPKQLQRKAITINELLLTITIPPSLKFFFEVLQRRSYSAVTRHTYGHREEIKKKDSNTKRGDD